MKKITKVLAAILIAGLFFSCNNNTPIDEEQNQDQQQQPEQGQSDPVQNNPEEKPPVDEKVEAVTFSVKAGEITEKTTVVLSSATKDAVIYYAFIEGEAASTLTKENYSSAAKYEAPVEIVKTGTLYAIAVKGGKTSEITSAKYTVVPLGEPIPEDSMIKWTAESTATAWSVYNYDDLVKLAEIVNGGKDLAGITITQKADITINESVLGEKFAEPAEAEAGVANADLINFAGIGSKKYPFAGTYDGNGKTISGLYIYGGQQGLGFFGGLNAATIKNVVILDAAVVNKNVWEGLNEKGEQSHDGEDDDRFGGLIGVTSAGNNTIENCIFVGTVGSKEAYDRNSTYEYIGGIIGRVESETTAKLKNCFSLVKLYGSAAPLVKKASGSVEFDNCYGVSLDKLLYTKTDTKVDFEAEDKDEIIAAVKEAFGVDLTEYFTKADLDVAPVAVAPVTFSIPDGEVTEGKTLALSTESKADIYYELVKAGETTTLTAENYESATKYSGSISLTEDVTIYAIAVGRHKASEITSAAYTVVAPTEPIPEDSIRKWTAESTVTTWSVYNFDDLVKLAEIVNGGKDLAGFTITQKADITINESVLGDGFAEPAEADAGVANANLKNFAGIGSKSNLFAGTYNGNGKTISGLYIYGGQQGLGFFGGLNGATIKNVIILDAAVINHNASGESDGSDDDRFGGLIGVTNGGESTIENCIFVGTVGSQAAKKRGGSYEYIGGILGRVEEKTIANIKNCFSLVKLYGSSAALVKKVSGQVSCTESIGVSLDKKVYKTKDAEAIALDEEGGVTKAELINAVKDASGIDLTDYFTKAGL